MDKNEIIGHFNSIDGWFYPDEAEFLISITERAMREAPSRIVVEVGSYLGKSTVLLGWAAQKAEGKVFAIDPHEGEVTKPGGSRTKLAPTLEGFNRNIAKAALQGTVEAIQKRSIDVKWTQQHIGLLFIDGLHDYASVATDYAQFGSWVPQNGFIAWHDYSPMWPDVMRVIEERKAYALNSSGPNRWRTRSAFAGNPNRRPCRNILSLGGT